MWKLVIIAHLQSIAFNSLVHSRSFIDIYSFSYLTCSQFERKEWCREKRSVIETKGTLQFSGFFKEQRKRVRNHRKRPCNITVLIAALQAQGLGQGPRTLNSSKCHLLAPYNDENGSTKLINVSVHVCVYVCTCVCLRVCVHMLSSAQCPACCYYTWGTHSLGLTLFR